MTRFADGIESGIVGVTSAQSSRAGVILARNKRFTGGGNVTWTTVLPAGALGVTATLWVLANGSAATSDRITINTGATTLTTLSSFGSAIGRFNSTTAGMGTVVVNTSGSWSVGTFTGDNNATVPLTAILSSVDTATDYGLVVSFRRPFKPGM